MKETTLKNRQTGEALVAHCFIARTFFSRFLGLMGRRELPADQALCFPHCNSIHTFFMRFAIDVILIDRMGEVVAVFESLKPWRMTLPRRGAAHTIELTGGRAAQLGIGPGVRLVCEGVWN